ncbi:MAG: hypothetical protein QNJ62_08135 [Methyloceanibacter sp.]|nr:hypothetical protein [Methyloceanibacter sp.]
MTKIAQTTNKFSFLSKFALLILAGFMFANIANPVPAYATNVQQCYNNGKAEGLRDGYTDGFKGAYRASYNDTISGVGTLDTGSQACSNAYAKGYAVGYPKGYKNGEREGSAQGKEDAQAWKGDLRERMRQCMQTGQNCP